MMNLSPPISYFKADLLDMAQRSNDIPNSAVKPRLISTPSPEVAMQQNNRLPTAAAVVDYRAEARARWLAWCERTAYKVDRLTFEHMTGIRPPPMNEDK